MFKMAFKFQPIEVEGEKKKTKNIATSVNISLLGGKATHIVPRGMFCSISGHHLSGLIIISLD